LKCFLFKFLKILVDVKNNERRKNLADQFRKTILPAAFTPETKATTFNQPSISAERENPDVEMEDLEGKLIINTILKLNFKL
jgi:hypothetical protein